jgi:hypothetical protein
MFQIRKSHVGGVAIVLFLVYVVNFLYAVSSNQTGGTFGDTFGAANALFSGSALFFLVLAFLSQREELHLIKEERDDTRKLLEGQERINSLQEIAMQKQSFEQSFFSLIKLISDERRALDLPTRPNSSVTVIVLARSFVDAKINDHNSLINWDLDNSIEECGTTARLFITAHGYLKEQYFSDQQELKYVSTLHALLDADFAHVFTVLVARWFADDPRVLPAFRELNTVDFLEENSRGLASDLISNQ